MLRFSTMLDKTKPSPSAAETASCHPLTTDLLAPFRRTDGVYGRRPRYVKQMAAPVTHGFLI